LKEFNYVFPSECPIGLSPFRCIKHQIDLVPGVYLPINQVIEQILKRPMR